jgi:hypothetical protein
MTDLTWQIVARLEILERIAQYGVYIDAGEFESFEALLAEDVALHIVPEPGFMQVPVHGRRAVRDAMEGRYREVVRDGHQRRHVTSNTVFDELTPDRARVRSFMTVLNVVKAEGRIELRGTGVYKDEFRRVNGRWLFGERHILLDALGK